jgi:ubiquinone/menaquinone biosynthesis C-methylase UbiE
MAFHRDPESMRRFYDGFHPWYRFIEGNTGRSVALALAVLDPDGTRFKEDCVLEHCCGTGSLALEMAPRCRVYSGRDQSEGMLKRAGRRWIARLGPEVSAPFERESVLDFNDPPASVDWVAISFALHLFPPADEKRILASLWKSARKGLIVVEHSTSFFLSLVEAVEGSWYGAYRHIDFAAIAGEMGADFIDRDIEGTRVMEFTRRASS